MNRQLLHCWQRRKQCVAAVSQDLHACGGKFGSTPLVLEKQSAPDFIPFEKAVPVSSDVFEQKPLDALASQAKPADCFVVEMTGEFSAI